MNTTLLMLDAAASGKVIEYSSWGFSDRVSEALSVSLLGIGTVFAVLAVLWGALELFRLFFYELPKRRENGGVSEKAEKVVKTEAPVTQSVPVASASTGSDEEIVAAITAAIAVVMDKPATSFRVVSFRRTGTR